MMKNKDPSDFIKQFKGIFQKIYTVPISGEKNSMPPKILAKMGQNSFLVQIYRQNNYL